MINQLPFADAPTGRYVPVADGNALYMRIEAVGPETPGQLGVVRRSGLPRVDRRGSMRALSLAQDEGLYEPTHFVLFPNRILGLERNFYGPTQSRFEWYLESVGADFVDRVRLAVVPRSGALERLRRLGEIRMLKIRVARDVAGRTRSLDRRLATALEAAKHAGDSEEVEVVLTSSKYSRSGFHLPWLMKAGDYLSDEIARGGTSEFTVRGLDTETGSITDVDLLSEVVISKKVVPLSSARERAVVSSRMYDAIRDAYAENRSDLESMVRGNAS